MQINKQCILANNIKAILYRARPCLVYVQRNLQFIFTPNKSKQLHESTIYSQQLRYKTSSLCMAFDTHNNIRTYTYIRMHTSTFHNITFACSRQSQSRAVPSAHPYHSVQGFPQLGKTHIPTYLTYGSITVCCYTVP